MYIGWWLGAAGMIGVVIALIASAVRRERGIDLGSVSGSWIAHHRE